MRFVCPIPMRQALITLLALGGLLAWAAPVAAQGFGIGARMAWVTREVEADVDPEIDADALRFVGGQVRLLSQRFGFEVSRTTIRRPSSSSIRRSRKLRYRRRFSCAWPAAAFLRSCWAGEAGIAARSRRSAVLTIRASARPSSAGTAAGASRYWPAGISVSTQTTATRSSTLVTTMTMTWDSSAGCFRCPGTAGRCGRSEPPSYF